MGTYLGWHQVAYLRELHADLTGVALGGRRLLLVRAGGRIRAFDADCPHRGADLSAGTLLDDTAVVCPFHGRRIGLGIPGDDNFCTREYRTLVIGGLVFVLFDESLDRGFARYAASLDRTRSIVPGFAIQVCTRPELVIENAFDHRHFRYVHGLRRVPVLRLEHGPDGQFCVFSEFASGNMNQWQAAGGATKNDHIGFVARVFSPNLCVTELDAGGNKPQVLTAATPQSSGTCVIRVSLALLPEASGVTNADATALQLLRDSKTSIEQDRRIWERLSPRQINNLVADDDLVARYHAFCAAFVQQGDG